MKFFDLFAGIGGFHEGLSRAGHECVGACEIDPRSRAVYARHFPGTELWEDATKIRPGELPDFKLLCAGFPCQAFSNAGKRFGFDDTRGTLFFEICRIAHECLPPVLLLENVQGLLNNGSGRTFAQILLSLDELGYDAEWQLLNGSCWLPQNRPRVVIVGHLRGRSRPGIFPLPEGHTVDAGKGCAQPAARQRMEDASTIDANYGKGPDGKRTMIYMSQKNANMVRRVQDRDETWTITTRPDFAIRDGLRRLTDWQVPQARRIYDASGISATIGVGNSSGDCMGLYRTGPRPASRQNGNGRPIKDPDEDTFTMTTRPPQILITDRIRRLTPTECEALQGFPRGWTEGHPKTHRYRMLGNAMMVPMAEAVGRVI